MIKLLSDEDNHDQDLAALVLKSLIKLIRHSVNNIEPFYSMNPSFTRLFSRNVDKKLEKLHQRRKLSKEVRKSLIPFVRALYDVKDPIKALGIQINEFK